MNIDKMRAHQSEAASVGNAAPKIELDRRLPDGSRFEMVYDAAEKKWKGSLIVPSPVTLDEPDQTYTTFSKEAHALFALCRALDRAYRQSLWKAQD